jgi:hypothetical protein
MSLKNFSVRSVDTFVVRNWILRKHYAKRMPSISYCFELLNENNLTVGVCSFGRPAAHSLIKNAINGLYQNNFLELNRLITNDDSISKVQKLKLKYGENNVYMIERPQKHRYFYFLGTKNDKKNMLKNLKYKIQPYPKGQNKNYDASYQPTIQTKLF